MEFSDMNTLDTFAALAVVCAMAPTPYASLD